ncbi:PAN2-PAN3 deadenylation complex catalytic subunit PAN2 isoform X2 [Anthonomus grandis grandis]|uniref:PAN2-PAN3 deadenylation complex catalytic subunit PAN2 isoform X2 n=1 Tax=Anthonomus grandis grandis TaxID=2921223 RepID=UPI002166316D|nr:PAN2-PAN3 deadenylation complex catalytic subunit PAN2 isoform X2 [Anthonomus grandis grandis]
MYYDSTGLAVVGSAEPPTALGLESEYVQTQCILADGGDRFGVSSLCFDKSEELLWMGNQGGHVTSYFSNTISKYTSFQIHANEEVRQIVTSDEGLLALTASSLRYQIRRGIPVYTHTSSNMADMQSMLQVSPSRLLMGGHGDKIVDFNLDICKEAQVVTVQDGASVMLRPHARFVCCGSPSGSVQLRDPITLKQEHTIDTHTGSLSDFDVQGNLMVTCGFSNRLGNLAVDRFLMVFDLRMLRAITPIQTVIDPLYLRFMPLITSKLVVVSASGQAQILDTIALETPKICLLQVDCPGAMIYSFDVSNTNQAIAFGDSGGRIHLFSNRESPVFNPFSRPTELPDPVVQYPSFSIDDYSTPLSSIPMPYVPPGVPLLSDWPAHLTQYVYRKPPKIDQEILRTMKMQGSIGYAPNPRHTRRNQVPYDLMGQNGHPLSNRSPKHQDIDSNFIAIPKRYRKIDMKYNKLGQDEFQFDNYNKTGLVGLEAVLPNAYCNAVIQVLYYIEPLRAALLSHLCSKEFCLSCELGFLFHMLSNSPPNQPCQPGNFLRAFRTVPEVSALGLILSDLAPEVKQKINLAALIQSWNRFILHQMHVELNETRKRIEEKKGKSHKSFVYKEIDFPAISNERTRKHSAAEVNNEIETEKREDLSEISNIFGSKQTHTFCCLKCGEVNNKGSIILACNLNYPTGEPEREEWTFCDILTKSLCPEQTTPAWCETCSKFSPTSQKKSLPAVFSINTMLNNDQNKQFWQTQMDKMVAKVSSADISKSNTPTTTPTNTPSSKPCRYGDHCSRPGCRFRHSFDSTPPPIPVNNPYCSNNWLPHGLRVTLRETGLEIVKTDAADKKNGSTIIDPSTNGKPALESREYELSAVVCHINDQNSPDKKNLVALIKVPQTYLKNKENTENRWYLFNDFSICPVPAQEAVWFSLDWKIPCVLYYSALDINDVKTEIHHPINQDVFTDDTYIVTPINTTTFTPLLNNEGFKAGDLVAMDAEFVTLNQEEAELRGDGKMTTVKPSQMSVGRITCIRGQGPLEGTPFIDDYISTQEQVVDYLTKFSGIKPGDLDANFSSKHLTTLKSTYVKLRFLQDNGVVFVGHGLKNDFRVINLVVPPDQIIDTVQLFHLRHHRMVSLRFLAWHFLGINIQGDMHDSVEDARAALQLYKKYKELKEANKVGEALAELYEIGEQLKWKVPVAESPNVL